MEIQGCISSVFFFLPPFPGGVGEKVITSLSKKKEKIKGERGKRERKRRKKERRERKKKEKVEKDGNMKKEGKRWCLAHTG